ncbi:MAG: hypothetical protein K9K93_06955 [Acholeplasmataceae bacterium]|nr:hypothetical protein [Acholeplasmataceae bacterium]
MIDLTLSPDDDIQKQLDMIPMGERIHMSLSPGVYRQKIVTRHHDLLITGTSAEEVIIVYDDHAGRRQTQGLKMMTFETPTLSVLGDRTTLMNLTIANDAGPKGQAIALALYGDRTTVLNTLVTGHQDTLFIGPLPKDLCIRYTGFLDERMLRSDPSSHLFQACEIRGDVDVIFGAGSALFDQCWVIALGNGYLCAPATPMEVPFGFVFKDSDIESLKGEPYLARPWRSGGAVLFQGCRFKGTFHEDRFHHWDKREHRLVENPYVQSLLSKPLSKEEAARLDAFVERMKAAPYGIRRN